jgi:Ca2+-binding EF-hand superfamily protein
MVSTIGNYSASSSYFLQALQDRYAKIDSDSDGSVTLAEFQAGAPQGVSEASQQELFGNLDSNGDGALTQDEFTTGLISGRPPQPALSGQNARHLAELFQNTDSDSDGSLTLDEFKAGAPDGQAPEGAPSLDEIFAQADTNGDSILSEDEFTAALSGGPQGAGGPPPGGPPPGGAAGSGEEESASYDPLDTNKDGQVSIDELLSSYESSDTEDSSSSDLIKQFLETIDQDDDNAISQQEAKTGLNALRKATMDYLISLQTGDAQALAA